MTNIMRVRKAVQIELTEAVVKAIIEQAGPSVLMAAINNVCCHGKIFAEQGLTLDGDDETLSQWYAGIEQMRKAAMKMEI